MLSPSETTAHQGSLSLRSELHLTRKAWHIFTGLSGLALYETFQFSPHFMATVLAVVGGLGFMVDFFRLRLPEMNRLVLMMMGPLMRESERNGMSGLPFYALGVSLTLFFYPEKLAILAILFLIFADPIASVVGILYGQDRILKNKSLQGSFAGFVTCYVLTLVYGIYYIELSAELLFFSLFAGVIGALSEMFPGKLDDNLTIPVLSGFGLTFLNLFFKLY